jgi:hypothetical protein
MPRSSVSPWAGLWRQNNSKVDLFRFCNWPECTLFITHSDQCGCDLALSWWHRPRSKTHIRIRAGQIGGAGISRRRLRCRWPADRQFIRHAAGQLLRPARFARILHWWRNLRPRIAGRIFLRRLGRLSGFDRRIFLRIDAHLNRDLTILRVARGTDRLVIGIDIWPSGVRAMCRRRGGLATRSRSCKALCRLVCVVVGHVSLR